MSHEPAAERTFTAAELAEFCGLPSNVLRRFLDRELLVPLRGSVDRFPFRAAGNARVLAQLHAHQVAPAQLKIEITESLVLDYGQIATLIESAHKAGMQVALDDFGTGYSSLGYLRSFSFDRIKIDKSFVQDMGKSREALSIVRAITGMSGSLLIKTTAEGVETDEQFEQLKAEGCSHFQGYLFGRPQPASERIEMLD